MYICNMENITKFDWETLGLLEGVDEEIKPLVIKAFDENTRLLLDVKNTYPHILESITFPIIKYIITNYPHFKINIKKLLDTLCVEDLETINYYDKNTSALFYLGFSENYVKNQKFLPKLLVIGNARHGKDTLAELLRDQIGLIFQSSSQAAAEIFIYDELKEKYGYKTPEECFEDRMNHRPEWYQMICDYNKDDRAKLAKGILERSDCYVGMRDRDEIKECIRQELFDLIIWVDASKRLPLESSDSFNIDQSCADIIVENNGTFEEFKEKVMRLGKILSK